MRNTGKIIVLAFPDTYVQMSTEFICKVLPLVGLGTRDYIKAGHAALVLIDNATGEAKYFDFGRYVTPQAHGRVRGENTDAELAVPIKAVFGEEDQISNLDSFLIWLDANPQKTHGSGRLLASVCDEIDYESALYYITQLQNRGSIPYGVFEKAGSNCSRFVTDTILSATDNDKIIRWLKFNKLFTPSTVGNVEKAAIGNPIFEVYNGNIKEFAGSAFKENLTNYFDKTKAPSKKDLTNKNLPVAPSHYHKLDGTGSIAYFEIVTMPDIPKFHYRIRRYNESLEEDFDGIYSSKIFNISEAYTFVYDSHCAFCHVNQGGIKIRLQCIDSFSNFSS